MTYPRGHGWLMAVIGHVAPGPSALLSVGKEPSESPQTLYSVLQDLMLVSIVNMHAVPSSLSFF